MSAVVDAISEVVSGTVEAVGDVVESVVDVVEDVGSAIDDYVIQPILDDPLTAVATVAGAYFLGPLAVSSLGTSTAVGAGLGAAAGNTAAGLAQGEDFDEAIKGGVIAGTTVGLTHGAMDYFGGESGVPSSDLSLPDVAPEVGLDIDAFGNAIDPMANPYANYAAPDITPIATAPVDISPIPDGLATPDLEFSASAPAAASASAPATVDYGLAGSSTPSAGLNIPAPDISSVPTDYLLDGIDFPGTGLDVPLIGPSSAIPGDLLGNVDYSQALSAGVAPPGPGLQLPSSPTIPSLGGQGLTVDAPGLQSYTSPEGAFAPETSGGTLGEFGLSAPAPEIAYPSAAAGATGTQSGSWLDRLTSVEGLKGIGTSALDYAMDNPLTTLAGISLLGSMSGAPEGAPPPPRGSTQDENFKRRMDLYNYLRDRQIYADDLYRYGQTGGEHEFFTNTRFVPIPIEAKTGGLMSLKRKYEQGGVAQPMPMQQDPRMAAVMQGAGRGMPPGRAPMPAKGGLAQAGMGGVPNIPQGMSQNRPQRQQRMNRNPQTSYYQYGQPPADVGQVARPGMNQGGALNMVRSYNLGGGADGRSDDVDALLSDGEYVFDAETVAMLGNGSSEAGAKRLDQMRENVRRHKGQNLAKGDISPDAKSPLEYLKG